MAQALGQMDSSKEPASTLKTLLKGVANEEFSDPPSADHCYRGSGLYYVCAREEVLAAQCKRKRVRKVDGVGLLTLSLGSGMHYAMQNLVLPSLGVLRGAWKCLSCGLVWGCQQSAKPLVEVAIPRPNTCKCGGTEFLFEEYHVVDTTYGISGHMDGLLVLPGHAGMGVLEIKSISDYNVDKNNVKKIPRSDHVFQANVYMWLAGLQWARLVYWVKGMYAVDPSVIEHHLERDEGLIEQAKSMLTQIRVGLRQGTVPERTVCAHRLGKRAQLCPVLQECFGDPEPDAGVGLF